MGPVGMPFVDTHAYLSPYPWRESIEDIHRRCVEMWAGDHEGSPLRGRLPFLVVKAHQETIVELIEACHWPL